MVKTATEKLILAAGYLRVLFILIKMFFIAISPHISLYSDKKACQAPHRF